MTDLIKFLRELGIDMDGKQVERIAQWLNTDLAEKAGIPTRRYIA